MFLLVGRHVQQPKQKKERHHGRHDFGIGNLPRTTMVATATLDDLSL